MSKLGHLKRNFAPFNGGHCCPPAKEIFDPPQYRSANRSHY
ncbi:hypothetical protein P7H19_22245 [Paenibacillus larvae]|nr:hypothetical protein [Paenibacillus larvae]MDT2238466.1 hypothetical protein [Paenibacillus larvae]